MDARGRSTQSIVFSGFVIDDNRVGVDFTAKVQAELELAVWYGCLTTLVRLGEARCGGLGSGRQMGHSVGEGEGEGCAPNNSIDRLID